MNSTLRNMLIAAVAVSAVQFGTSAANAGQPTTISPVIYEVEIEMSYHANSYFVTAYFGDSREEAKLMYELVDEFRNDSAALAEILGLVGSHLAGQVVDIHVAKYSIYEFDSSLTR